MAKRVRGYTLLQVVTVMAIIAILAAIGLPVMNRALQTRRLNGASRQIVGDLRYAQSLAMSTGGLYHIVVITNAAVCADQPNCYRIESSSDGGTTWSPLANTIPVDIPALYTGVSFTITDSNANQLTEIRFNSRGVAFNPANPTFPVTVNVTGPIGGTNTTNTVTLQKTGATTVKDSLGNVVQ